MEESSGHRLGRDCLVMELVEGQTLRQLMAGGALPLERLLPIWRQITEGLSYAHARGVIHRDLKVDNVMVTPLGHAKILDFGLAKRIEGPASSLTQEGGLLGTLYSMAPEQARGKRVDARADLFSLGVLFYETLFGTPPFDGESAHELWLNVMLHPHPSAAGRADGPPPELATLIDRLLAKDPAARPQRAEDVLALLDRYVPGSLATAAGPPSPAALPISGPATVPIVPPQGDPLALATRVLPAEGRRPPAAGPAPGERRRASGAAWRVAALLAGAALLAAAPLWLSRPAASPQGPPSLALLADLTGLPPEGRALAGLLAERVVAGEGRLPPLLPPAWTLDAPKPPAASLGRAGILRIEDEGQGLRLTIGGAGGAAAVVELGSGSLGARLARAEAAVYQAFGKGPPAGDPLPVGLDRDPALALAYGEARAWIFVRRADLARQLLRAAVPEDLGANEFLNKRVALGEDPQGLNKRVAPGEDLQGLNKRVAPGQGLNKRVAP